MMYNRQWAILCQKSSDQQPFICLLIWHVHSESAHVWEQAEEYLWCKHALNLSASWPQEMYDGLCARGWTCSALALQEEKLCTDCFRHLQDKETAERVLRIPVIQRCYMFPKMTGICTALNPSWVLALD